jgi:MerR family transcriptional regulator, copper efflux regulator
LIPSDARGAEPTSGATPSAPPADLSRTGRHHIGAVTARTEVSQQTLRHWDEVGLVRPSGRTEGGFRLYSDVDIQRLLVIRRMKPLEFSLDEMKRLLDSLDLLAGTDGDEQQRREAATFVVDCHHRAEQSIARLRKRLAYASELTEVLAREARRVALEPTAEVEQPGDPG